MATKKAIPQARPLGFKENRGKNLVLYHFADPNDLTGFGHDAKVLEEIMWRIVRNHGRYFMESNWGFNHENSIDMKALPLIRKECKAAGIKLSIRKMTEKSIAHFAAQRRECWNYINRKLK